MITKLAIDGGEKVRSTPFPSRTPFGSREEELLLQAVRSQNLFGKSGTMVKDYHRIFQGDEKAQDAITVSRLA